jgi:chromosome segregation ATPase
MGWKAMSMAMLQHVHDQVEDLGQATSLKAKLRDLKDDMALKEALLKSYRELETQNAKDLAALKQKLSRAQEELAKEKEKNVGLDVENLKLKDEVSHLKAKSNSDCSAITALCSELQETDSKLQKTQVELQETQEKLEEAYQDMDTMVDDSYQDFLKTLQFLNPGIEFNTRGLCKFHGVKDGKFWDFLDCHNHVPLDPLDPRLEPFDCHTPPPSEAGPRAGGANAGEAQ